ncbi:branched-chain amino acid transport system II carrier protein [Companilactobacillus alimentarius]|uniref:Branched-chain amino acid transport system carrier protein n=1 Tax=Companilactobacillus alimentarius DSM 20249 TaxID=1423720 RepID=A0A2K9HQ70_9LACO|nr:branched-chain amino acid transport system II carrier protein [Companilactobacillus alimentarius]AUI71662.1 branched-chain amino acid transport system II carrier protein [Companilactobacillus alimentarius DSM 20249]KRK78325.1 branched-chain amino acid transport protein [Companilactobacillus alimentarius DSM 20249]MDT6953349.1 branched-chain amino acid transport system II carrier protein [Companilactobacillus alimentarius]GEO44598.1 branched-chain amino acid transport system carrier protein [
MKTKLTWKNLFFIGSMLFGLFFGAGNLIFPVFLGQQAGRNVWLAIIGLLITGVGLPLLGVASMGITASNSVFDLASKVNRPYAYIFTILLYVTMGPLFAIPRLATISFQLGIAPFVAKNNQGVILLFFSAIFFIATWFLSRKPSELMTYVGKWLTPIFLILLGILVITAIIKPMGSLNALPQNQYMKAPVLTGFTEGYNTMDALASLAFGVVVIETIKSLGITEPAQIAKDTIKSGVISVIIMGVIYAFLALIGTMSVAKLPLASNGGITLAQVFNYYFGSFGSLLLALIAIIACLKTSIGLVSAFGETAEEMFPKFNYQITLIVVSVASFLIANIGLTKLINYSTPILMFLYPLAIVLIVVAVLSPLIGESKWVYGMTTVFTIIPAFFAGLEALPKIWREISWIQNILHLNKYLPLADLGLGWVVPAIVGLLLGFVISKYKLSIEKR